MIIAEGNIYEIVEDVREGFKEEDFQGRYSDILSKYDYIVGDWGYGQLRLKGFFDDKNQKATYDTKISTIQDYLYEYCNFGCSYFLLRKTGKVQVTKPEKAEKPQKKTAEPAVENEQQVGAEV